MTSINSAFAVIFALLLSACGGGGSSSTPTPPPNVLLVHSLNPLERNDLVAKLTAFGVLDGISVFDGVAATPTLAELQAVDVVLLVSNLSFQDSTGLGNVMADYVDAGGALVLGMFSMSSAGSDTPEGRFFADNYYAIEPSMSNGTIVDGGMTVVNAAHPILAGVSTFAGGANSISPQGSVLAPGSTMIATWNDGASTPLIAVREIGSARRVDLGFFPVTTDGIGQLDPTTDAMLIVANALRWASRRL